jgi:hypothetical protein
MVFKKEEAGKTSEPLYSVKELLRKVEMGQIVQQCPKVRELVEVLCANPLIE